jgi:hypothetical protein
LAKVKTRENSEFKQSNHIKISWFSIPEVGATAIAIDNHMAIIQV